MLRYGHIYKNAFINREVNNANLQYDVIHIASHVRLSSHGWKRADRRACLHPFTGLSFTITQSKREVPLTIQIYSVSGSG